MRAVLSAGLLEQHQAAAVIDISAALVPFCEQRAHVGEATQWLETALAMAEVIDVAAEGRALHALGVLNIHGAIALTRRQGI